MSDWRPRLIASDMDGTLLRWDDTVSEATVAELDRWRGDGVPVVLATGRPPRWMRRIREVLGHGTAVCCNGAVLLDLDPFTVLEEHPVTTEVLRAVTGELRHRVADHPGPHLRLIGSRPFSQCHRARTPGARQHRPRGSPRRLCPKEFHMTPPQTKILAPSGRG